VIDLKYQRQATFVRQANIAHGPQQVNNGVTGDAIRALENQTEQNELLEGLGYGGKAMDTRTAAATEPSYPAVETLAASHRPPKP